tara:strand:- start:383 stop:814 length:432 start_codon:yes stop_codon:yes gene_type:complete
MTILEASGILYQWFSENDSFSMKDDFIKLIPITETPNRDKASVLAALSDLEEALLLKSCVYEENRYWTLKKSFSSFEQSVSISPEVALTISIMVNKFCELMDNESEQCDPVNLQERDIKSLLYLANFFVSQQDKNLDMSEGEL